MADSLSVVIMTLNEEKNIVDCVKSADRATEVIVVDSGSTDRTTQLAAGAGARVVEHAMTDYASQRNFANSIAKGDWVFHLDADERLTPALWSELVSVISSGSTHSAYLVPRLNFVFGAPLHHGGWYPQYEMRLQRRGHASWSRPVHETSVANGTVGKLHQPYEHRGHPDVHTFLVKTDRYTTLEAEAMAEQPVAKLGLLAVAVPGTYFVYKYVVQAGFLDGWRGLAAALLLSFYRAVAYVKAIEAHSQRIPRSA